MNVIIETIEPNKIVAGKTKNPITLPSKGDNHMGRDNKPIS